MAQSVTLRTGRVFSRQMDLCWGGSEMNAALRKAGRSGKEAPEVGGLAGGEAASWASRASMRSTSPPQLLLRAVPPPLLYRRIHGCANRPQLPITQLPHLLGDVCTAAMTSRKPLCCAGASKRLKEHQDTEHQPNWHVAASLVRLCLLGMHSRPQVEFHDVMAAYVHSTELKLCHERGHCRYSRCLMGGSTIGSTVSGIGK